MAETEGEHIDGACIKREETKRKGKEKEKKPRVQKRERECACAHEEERWRLPGWGRRQESWKTAPSAWRHLAVCWMRRLSLRSALDKRERTQVTYSVGTLGPTSREPLLRLVGLVAPGRSLCKAWPCGGGALRCRYFQKDACGGLQTLCSSGASSMFWHVLTSSPTVGRLARQGGVSSSPTGFD